MRRLMAKAFAWFVLGISILATTSLWADPTEETPGASAAASDYTAGKRAIEAKNWKSAIDLLNKAALQDNRNPDVQNLLGYAYRNAAQFSEAFKHYNEALRLNPRHRGAHEYIGEAYLLTNDLEKAQEHLAALEKICVLPCEEYEDLRKSIEAYKRKH
jgi:Flp pilus assembly protein TadD